ncbi:glycosyltransferase [Acidithiobacillus thiooxidans]|uniref:Uncharacterized protein n=1 Tax=Acidithiobacillus thiooxidans ATCC 19377 TaxID=637390 RepID=A0A543Q7T9_ACITH|nr:glycosyltransferase [Acidithiobacillus thiooxidans]MDR7927854.1 glycosyltransferase [Acidithiobacillus thiooxidans]MDX5936107.1 glycosyltransferase [Acidithiobacillus thiooxidans]TQN52388.1 putative protein y4gI [Acidithiobacillus thiooxidans ATCC 19377]
MSITIGLPVYNGEKYIRTAISCIQNQTQQDFELIISDNNSSDRTLEICKKIAKNDDRIRVLKQNRNIGFIDNTKFILENCRTEFYLPASDDDYFSENYIEANINELNKNSALISCGEQVVTLSPQGTTNSITQNLCTLGMACADRFTALVNRELWVAWCGVYRRDFFASMLNSKDMQEHLYAHGSDVLLLAFTLLQGNISCSPSTFYFRQFPRTQKDYQETIDPSKTRWMQSITPMLDMFNRILDIIERFSNKAETKEIIQAYLSSIHNNRTWQAEFNREIVQAKKISNQQPFLLGKAKILLHNPEMPSHWDEEKYLNANPDVLQSLRIGNFSSGYDHFIKFGMHEGRLFSVISHDEGNKINDNNRNNFPFGVNIIGYVSGNLGLGVFARSVISSLLKFGIKISILDIDPGYGRGRHDTQFDYLSVQHPQQLPHAINLFIFPPGALLGLLNNVLGSMECLDRLNVLWTAWELPNVPKEWHVILQAMDVIMGISPFVTAAMATAIEGPLVINAPEPHIIPDVKLVQRDKFSLPADKVLFMSAYEPLSDSQRKNPYAAVEAFRRGVGISNNACLIIKVNSNDDSLCNDLYEFIGDDESIIVLCKSFSFEETISLYSCCDVFISLHRSEGFGIVPLEFMALGKPVIATAWSGNMAYMNADSACLVTSKLISVNGSLKVYHSDFVGPDACWADPSVDEAASWVRVLLNSPKLRNDFGERAKKSAINYMENASRCDWLASIAAFYEQYKIFSTRKLRKKEVFRLLFNKEFGISFPWLLERRFLSAEQRWISDCCLESASLGFDIYCFKSILENQADLCNATEKSVQKGLCSKNYNFYFIDSVIEENAIINSAILGTDTGWLFFVDAGDQFAPDAIFRIQMAIQNHPEWQLIYTDEDSLTADGQHVNPHCKPDFNIDYLRSLPYIGGLLIIKKELFEALGGFDPQSDGAEDYDFVLRAWEKIGDAGIGHIPEVLYHRLQGGGHCNKSVEEILQVSQAALQRHLQRLNIAAEVLPGPFPPATRVRYPLTGTPLVSIIIPTRNQLGYLQRCVESLIEKTKFAHYEILIVDNDSDDAEARTYLDMLAAQEEQLGGRLRVLRHPGPFNFSAMNNRAVEQARGDYVLLLNNDTAALHDDWLDEMVSQILRPEVGIVGAKLLFPDGKIQHAGVILGMRGPAEHPFIGQPPEYRGYFGRAMLTQNLSAVTGACLLIGKSLYQELGGLDEKQFQVSYNDIDLCLKAREAGHKIVFTPWAMLLHEGSASQRGEVEKKPSPEKEKRFAGEKMAFYQKWLPQLAFDPAYNRHLSLASTDFLLEDQAALTWDPEWRPRPRILVHPADREGCGEYRIISPMRALQKAGRAQGWETMRIFEPAEMERFSPESIVLQRQMEWPQIEALERHKKLLKTFRVFEIDDLITNLPVKSLHKAQIHKDIAKRFRKAAGLCNRLVVATEPLAKAYKGFADELRVQPNCIEDAIWGSLQPRRRAEAKPRVGWAGGVGHTGDLEMISDVVRDLADEVDWVFFGLCPDALRPYVREFHTGVPLPKYPNKLASLDLDLALAPLENNPFNEAKSHLRILEYGILGYPVICSDIFPYQGDFPVTRVANRYRDWVRAIREQIADRQALAMAGDRLREHVRAHWLLEEHLDDWLAAWLP